MQSTNGSDGSYTLTVTFAIGTDLDTLLSPWYRTRSTARLPQLPQPVQRAGRQRQEGEHEHPADREPLRGRRSLRRDVSQQLRDHQSAEPARTPTRRRAGHDLRRGPLQHACLAGPRQAQGLRADGARRAERDPAPEHSSGGRAARRAAGAARSGLPVHGQYARSSLRGRRSSRTSSSRPSRRRRSAHRRSSSSVTDPPPPSCASRTSRESSSSQQLFTVFSGLSGKKAAHVAVFALPGANALDVGDRDARPDGEDEQERSPPASST